MANPTATWFNLAPPALFRAESKQPAPTVSSTVQTATLTALASPKPSEIPVLPLSNAQLPQQSEPQPPSAPAAITPSDYAKAQQRLKAVSFLKRTDHKGYSPARNVAGLLGAATNAIIKHYHEVRSGDDARSQGRRRVNRQNRGHHPGLRLRSEEHKRDSHHHDQQRGHNRIVEDEHRSTETPSSEYQDEDEAGSGNAKLIDTRCLPPKHKREGVSHFRNVYETHHVPIFPMDPTPANTGVTSTGDGMFFGSSYRQVAAVMNPTFPTGGQPPTGLMISFPISYYFDYGANNQRRFAICIGAPRPGSSDTRMLTSQQTLGGGGESQFFTDFIINSTRMRYSVIPKIAIMVMRKPRVDPVQTIATSTTTGGSPQLAPGIFPSSIQSSAGFTSGSIVFTPWTGEIASYINDSFGAPDFVSWSPTGDPRQSYNSRMRIPGAETFSICSEGKEPDWLRYTVIPHSPAWQSATNNPQVGGATLQLAGFEGPRVVDYFDWVSGQTAHRGHIGSISWYFPEYATTMGEMGFNASATSYAAMCKYLATFIKFEVELEQFGSMPANTLLNIPSSEFAKQVESQMESSVKVAAQIKQVREDAKAFVQTQALAQMTPEQLTQIEDGETVVL